jgi:hypothetical protein
MTHHNINTCAIDNGTSRSAYARTRRRPPWQSLTSRTNEQIESSRQAGEGLFSNQRQGLWNYFTTIGKTTKSPPATATTTATAVAVTTATASANRSSR